MVAVRIRWPMPGGRRPSPVGRPNLSRTAPRTTVLATVEPGQLTAIVLAIVLVLVVRKG